MPFPEATTRAEARDNALHYVAKAESYTGNNDLFNKNAALGNLWTRIAQTFPEDETVSFSEPEGMTLVAEGWMEEAVAALDFKNRNRVEPGYSLMAVTAQEMRTVMALRTGLPKDPESPAKGIATIPATDDTVTIAAGFYAVLMAIVVDVLKGVGNQVMFIAPSDIEMTRERTVSMSFSDLPGEGPTWKVWLA